MKRFRNIDYLKSCATHATRKNFYLCLADKFNMLIEYGWWS